MSAGTWNLAFEMNGLATEPVHFRADVGNTRNGITASYQQQEIDDELLRAGLVTIASGIPGKTQRSLLHNSSACCTARLRPGAATVSARVLRTLFLHLRFVAYGRLTLKVAASLPDGDAVRFTDDARGLTANEPPEVLIWGDAREAGRFGNIEWPMTDRSPHSLGRSRAPRRTPTPSGTSKRSDGAFLDGTDRHHVGPDVGAGRAYLRHPKPHDQFAAFPIALVNDASPRASRFRRSGFHGQEQVRHPRLAGRGGCSTPGVRLGAVIPPTFVAATGEFRGECGRQPAQTGPRSDLNESAGGHAGS